MWIMNEDEKNVIRGALAEEFEMLIQKLNLKGNAHTVRQYISETSINE